MKLSALASLASDCVAARAWMPALLRLTGPFRLAETIRLPEPLRLRLDAWRALPSPPPNAPFQTQRWVVADTETSGLDPRAHRLLSIGALGLTRLRVDLADGFDTVLRQTHPSTHANILIHGIGEQAQRDGEDAQLALIRFLEFTGKAPLIAYHAPFDAAFVRRAMRTHLGFAPALPWLDLAVLLPALFDARSERALDGWLLRFGILPPVRHSALGDALATAQLAQIALHQAASLGLLHFAALKKLHGAARWLPP